MRRLATFAVALAVCAAAVVLAGAAAPGKKGKTYKIVFDNAFGLTEGGDFRVGGVTAGQTKSFEVSSGKPPKAVVTAEITQPGFDDFRSDASCDIKPQSLIGEYYVDCQAGSSPRKLRSGGTVPVEHTTSTIPADLVNNILRRPYRERLRLIITSLGTGLAGRPRDLQEVLQRAHPGLRETSRVLKILGDQNSVIERFIRDSDTVVQELERNKRDVARWIVESGRTAEISATRRRELRQTFRRFPGFLDELRPTMVRLGDLADEQTPLLADLQRAAPSLDEFLTRLGPFSKASRPAIRSLGDASRVGTRAFRKGREEVDELRRLAPQAKPTFKPLRQFLQTMDDRRRALENDARAKEGSPPAPDRTAIPGEGGFTGLEAIWNFIYWSGMSINGFDDVSHILRVSATESDCSPLKTNITQEEANGRFKPCLAWLGPNQPGLLGNPDPSARSRSAAAARREAGRPATRIGERRSPGQPDAGPLPGQRDISKPQVVLPPALQRLLDELPGAGGGRTPSLPGPGLPGVGGRDNQALDYLLGP